MRVTHPRLHAALLAGVRWAEDEATFVVTVGRFRAALQVEDTAFFVTEFDAASGEIALSDRSREPLDVASLRADADDALRCRVKGRFDARFTRAAQAHLAEALELEPPAVFVRTAAARQRAPRLRC